MSSSTLKSIFRDVDKVDWRQLVHAYGRAVDVPAMLWSAVSDDTHEQDRGWDGIWGALNHQGDFYDSTVATIPFFIRFLQCEEVPCRDRLLSYLYDRYLDAEKYGGDPMLEDPPGGEDPPTPMVEHRPIPNLTDETEEPDWENRRSMDLCAWQTGRAVRAGLPVYASLLDDSSRVIAGNAANLMLLWHESRDAAKQKLRATIDGETNPVKKAELLLKYGVYGSHRDKNAFHYWTAPKESIEVRTAAVICLARVIDPDPLPDDVRDLLHEATHPQCRVFGDLPWSGVYNRGPWTLPANMSQVLLPLATNNDNELRWRAVQGLMPGRKVERSLHRSETCPVLVKSLTDAHKEVRTAAAFALAEMGEEVFQHCPDIVHSLISAIDDRDESTSGHAARLLAKLSSHLTPDEKQAALRRTKAAAKRFTSSKFYVHFMSLGIQADRFLMEQHDAIQNPVVWSLDQLWQLYAFAERESNTLKAAEVHRRIADAFKADREDVVQAAVSVLSKAKDRAAVLGAAKWLTTIGPVARFALPAIDTCAGGKFDSYVDDQMTKAHRLIEEAVVFESTVHSNVDDIDAVGELKMLVAERISMRPEKWCAMLQHRDWMIRFQAASALAEIGAVFQADRELAEQLQDTIKPLLRDDAFDVIGISGEFCVNEQIYQWRRQTRSVSAAAVQALFSVGMESDDLLNGMLRESLRPLIRCGDTVFVAEYSPRQWQAACMSSPGGHVGGELRIRAARQDCHKLLWHGECPDRSLYAAALKALEKIILHLSGRLVEHDEF